MNFVFKLENIYSLEKTSLYQLAKIGSHTILKIRMMSPLKSTHTAADREKSHATLGEIQL